MQYASNVTFYETDTIIILFQFLSLNIIHISTYIFIEKNKPKASAFNMLTQSIRTAAK